MPRHNRPPMSRRKRRQLAVRRDQMNQARGERKDRQLIQQQHRGALISDLFPKGGLK